MGSNGMDGGGVLERASELPRQGQAFALATVVWRQGPSSGQLGSRAIITADGEGHGWIGGAPAPPPGPPRGPPGGAPGGPPRRPPRAPAPPGGEGPPGRGGVVASR